MVRDTARASTSKQPRKQRKARILAPMNRRRKMMASPLSRELRERNEFYPRRLTVRKGDVVMVRRGGFEGHDGKVLGVDLKTMKVTIDGVVYQKADNTSIPKPIDPSNIEIIKLDLSDRRRKKKFERILDQSSLSEEEISDAEEELEATESIEIASLKEESEEESTEEEGPGEGPTEEEEPEEKPTGEEEADKLSNGGSEELTDAGSDEAAEEATKAPQAEEQMEVPSGKAPEGPAEKEPSLDNNKDNNNNDQIDSKINDNEGINDKINDNEDDKKEGSN